MDWIIIAIVAVILFFAIRYIYKAKKQGVKCVGCPSGGCCSHSSGEKKDEQHSCCSCHEQQDSSDLSNDQ